MAILVPLLLLNQPARADDTAFSPEIEKLLALPEDKIDIGLAALTFAHDIYPAVDVQAYSKKIDQLAEEVRTIQAQARAQHLPGISDGPDDTARAISAVLFDREGYKFDHSPDSFSNDQNYVLSGTLDRKLGVCSTLPMLYIAVAQRLGLSVYAVEAPQHFFVRISTGSGAAARTINIEATSGGLPARDVWIIEQNHISPLAIERGTYMRTLTHRQYLSEFLNVNGHWYEQHGQEEKAIKYYTKAMEVNPQSPSASVGMVFLYEHRSMQAEDEFLFSSTDNNDLKKQVALNFDYALYYRKKLLEMGVRMEEFSVAGEAKIQQDAAQSQ